MCCLSLPGNATGPGVQERFRIQLARHQSDDADDDVDELSPRIRKCMA